MYVPIPMRVLEDKKDIKVNCAYFLGILLTSATMNIKEKK